jgi:hypothetical protein
VNELEIQERYQIVSHLAGDRPYRVVGSAYKKNGEDYYSMYLRLMPGTPFYISPHWDRAWDYLIFSGRSKRNDGSYRFFCKIGSAIYLSAQNVLEVHIPDLRQVYFLKLAPEDFHYDARQAA